MNPLALVAVLALSLPFVDARFLRDDDPCAPECRDEPYYWGVSKMNNKGQCEYVGDDDPSYKKRLTCGYLVIAVPQKIVTGNLTLGMIKHRGKIYDDLHLNEHGFYTIVFFQERFYGPNVTITWSIDGKDVAEGVYSQNACINSPGNVHARNLTAGHVVETFNGYTPLGEVSSPGHIAVVSFS
jgi:hypothetical protein